MRSVLEGQVGLHCRLLSNSVGVFWAPAATGTLAQAIAMNANPGFT